MDPESIFTALFIGGGIWLVLHLNRKRRLRNTGTPHGQEATSASAEERGTMPRIGQPGTLTKAQIQVLRDNNFVYDKHWSKEEAALVLDTLAYLRAVCRRVGDGFDAPLEVQNELLAFILVHEHLRNHVRAWGEQRPASGDEPYREADFQDLPADSELDEITSQARRLLKRTSG